MTPARARWTLSFADLCLVLLAFFVLMQARSGERERIAASMREAFGGKPTSLAREFAAQRLFQPGEAVLRPQARVELETMAREALASGRSLRISSTGMDPRTHRFDGWELAAARVAAVARALRAAGLPEQRIVVVMPAMDGKTTGQRIMVLQAR